MGGIAIAGRILERVKFFPGQKQGQRLQKAVGGEVGGQTQALLERGPAGGGIRADKTLIQQVGLGDMGRCRGFSLPLKCRAGAAQGGQQHVGGHPLHPQLALLTRPLLAALLAGNIGDICLLQPVRRQNALEVAADDKACAVRVGEQDKTTLLRQCAEVGRLFPVIEHGEAAHLTMAASL